MSATPTTLWGRVHAALAGEAETLLDAIVERFRAELPHYGRLPAEDIRPIAKANLADLLDVLRARRSPSADGFDGAAKVGEQRARQGIPIDELMRASRIVVQEVTVRERALARHIDLPDADLLDAAQLMQDWADLLMSRSAAAHRDVEFELARRAHDRRSRTVLGLLHGSLPPSEVSDLPSVYGLAVDQPYVPFRARPRGSTTLGGLERALDAESDRHRGLVTITDGDVVGFLGAAPAIGIDAVVGVGPSAVLRTLAPSFAVAGSLLEAAQAFGLRGAVDVDALGLRGPVHASGVLGDRLVARYVTPLTAEGEFGDTLLETLREYLRQGMHVDRTARILHVHPNTLRHRIRRAETLVGESFDDTERWFELWWALERARIGPRSHAVHPVGPPRGSPGG